MNRKDGGLVSYGQRSPGMMFGVGLKFWIAHQPGTWDPCSDDPLNFTSFHLDSFSSSLTLIWIHCSLSQIEITRLSGSGVLSSCWPTCVWMIKILFNSFFSTVSIILPRILIRIVCWLSRIWNYTGLAAAPILAQHGGSFSVAKPFGPSLFNIH